MSATFKLNLSEFQAANREYLATTARTLEEATNSRLSFVLKRTYEELFPTNAAGDRKRIRNYLNAFVGLKLAARATTRRRSAKSMPLRIYRILQARQRKAGQPGLYGAAMKAAAGKFRQRAIGSVGYLAAPVAKAWIALGRARGAIPGRPQQKAQATARATARPAEAGFSPVATVEMSGIFAGGEKGEVDSRYAQAFQKAFDLETAEIRRHLASKLRADGLRAGMKTA